MFTDSGREHTGLDAIEWATEVEKLGAGELVITSVDKEGTGEGYDLELIRMISDVVSIPVIAHGGAKSPQNVVDAIKIGNADAVAIASILHYSVIQDLHDLGAEYHEEGNTSFLNSGRAPKNISPTTLKEIRSELVKANIPTRN